MTEVLFYHLQRQPLERRAAAAAGAVARARLAGRRAGALRRSGVDALDAHLWTYRDDSFLPHGTDARSRGARRSRFCSRPADDNPNGATVRFLIDGAPLPADARPMSGSC